MKTSSLSPFPVFRTDCLVIGSGLAGMLTALKLADHSQVLLLCKDKLGLSNTFYAQGGIASVGSEVDSYQAHIADTVEAGAGLCHPEIVELVVREGPAVIAELIGYGVKFTHESAVAGGGFHLTREGGHSFRRVLHHRDTTGRAIIEALTARVRAHPSIILGEQSFVTELVRDQEVCLGAEILEQGFVAAGSTYLCTGGSGRLFSHTTNPPSATGDGVALAWRAGCRVANLEFVQFHPTCLFLPGAEGFLISEALRGEGGVLVDGTGREFLSARDARGSLAPRDIVARGIYEEMQRSGAPCVFLDVRHLGRAKLQEMFPTIFRRCRDLALDISAEVIPVVPAAHYSCGGVVVDSWGRTDLPGLFAVGEVACTGLHGANRLASNSLLEAAVFARRAGQRSWGRPTVPTDRLKVSWSPKADKARSCGPTSFNSHIMDAHLSLVRNDAGLTLALQFLAATRARLAQQLLTSPPSRALAEEKNLADLAWLTAHCALLRRESRGCHFNRDHPEKLEGAGDTIIAREGKFR